MPDKSDQIHYTFFIFTDGNCCKRLFIDKSGYYLLLGLYMKYTLLIFTLVLFNCTGKKEKEKSDQKMENKSMMLGLRTVCYVVPDVNKAKEWYAQAFGVKPYFDQPFYVGFNIGGFELGLQPEEKAPAQKSENVLCYWGVKDIQKDYKRLLQLGATEHEKPTNVGGEIVTASVKDPWGNVVGLIYNPEFKIQE